MDVLFAPTADDFNWRPTYSEATRLLEAGRDDEAVEHLLWMWEACRPKIVFVRDSYVAHLIEQYAQGSEAVRTAFTDLFDTCQVQLEQRKGDRDVWNDWLVLGQALGLQHTVVAFVRKHADERGRLVQAPERVLEKLFETLVFAGYLREAGLLLSDIAAKLRGDFDSHVRLFGRTEGLSDAVSGSYTSQMRWKFGAFYAAAVAADLRDGASAVAEAALAGFDDAEMRLRLAQWSAYAGHLTDEAASFLDDARTALLDYRCQDDSALECAHLELLRTTSALFPSEN